MHSMSVCTCMCVLMLWGLHCFDMLSCPDLQIKTASSSSWGGSPMTFFNSKYLFSGIRGTTRYSFPEGTWLHSSEISPTFN